MMMSDTQPVGLRLRTTSSPCHTPSCTEPPGTVPEPLPIGVALWNRPLSLPPALDVMMTSPRVRARPTLPRSLMRYEAPPGSSSPPTEQSFFIVSLVRPALVQETLVVRQFAEQVLKGALARQHESVGMQSMQIPGRRDAGDGT